MKHHLFDEKAIPGEAEHFVNIGLQFRTALRCDCWVCQSFRQEAMKMFRTEALNDAVRCLDRHQLVFQAIVEGWQIQRLRNALGPEHYDRRLPMAALVNYPGLLGFQREFIRGHSNITVSIRSRQIAWTIIAVNIIGVIALAGAAFDVYTPLAWQANLLRFVIYALVGMKFLLALSFGIGTASTQEAITKWRERQMQESIEEKTTFQHKLFREFFVFRSGSRWLHCFWNVWDLTFAATLILSGWYVSAVLVLLSRPASISAAQQEKETVAEFVKSLTREEVEYLDQLSTITEVVTTMVKARQPPSLDTA